MKKSTLIFFFTFFFCFSFAQQADSVFTRSKLIAFSPSKFGDYDVNGINFGVLDAYHQQKIMA